MESLTDEHLDIVSRTLADAPTAVVHEVVLSRPEKHNALSDRTIESLAMTFEAVKLDDGDAIVLAADGDDFSLGADVADLDPETIDDPAAPAERMQRLIMAIRSCPLPVVARVHGRAFGAEFLLCLGADLVVATDDATFALPEINLGMPVAGFATVLLSRLVGERRAREWLFTDTHVSGQTAAAAGFVTQLVPPSRVDESLDDLLVGLVENSGDALSALKSRMASPTPPDEEQLRMAERDAMETAFTEGGVSNRRPN
jgi:enoyl-CoA hydratase/carnithine racemase